MVVSRKLALARERTAGAAVSTFFVLGLSSEIQVCDFQGQFFGIDIGAIGQYDDRQVIVYEALDGRAEADGFAVVPHPFVTPVRIQEPAKAVTHRLAIVRLRRSGSGLYWNQRWPHLGFAGRSEERRGG